MATVKISQLPAIGPLAGTDQFPLVQGAVTNKATVGALDARYFRKGQEDAPGTELIYGQLTTNVSVTATSAASPTLIMSTGSRNYDGSPVLIDAFIGAAQAPSTGSLVFSLWDGASDLGYFGIVGPPVSLQTMLRAARRLTPSAGSHDFRMYGWLSAAGTGLITANTGGPSNWCPAFIRVTKV